MRLVADQVRGESIDKALAILKFSPKEASRRLENYYFLQLPTGNLKTNLKTLKKQIFLFLKSE